jgi:hypothetical protein
MIPALQNYLCQMIFSQKNTRRSGYRYFGKQGIAAPEIMLLEQKPRR